MLREAARRGLRGATRLWKPYSRIFMASDTPDWVISGEMREIGAIVRKQGRRLAPSWFLPFTDRQCVFFGSHFDLLLQDKWFNTSFRFATAYFHGRPGTGNLEFDKCFDNLKKYRDRISCIQVSHSAMRDVVLDSGIAPEKVFLIPIGINLKYFIPQTPDLKKELRANLGIPQDAVIIGSFQKDGVGWGEGLEPKLVKGPDVFLKVIGLLKHRITNIFILLSGPARGYVKAGLENLHVPYKHIYLSSYNNVCRLYNALDVYIVSSREEGGPRAILESMASGVPFVTTRVGQAVDLVRHGENGWLADIGDAEGIACWVEHIVNKQTTLEGILRCGLQTARNNSYESQAPLWGKFMSKLFCEK